MFRWPRKNDSDDVHPFVIFSFGPLDLIGVDPLILVVVTAHKVIKLAFECIK